MPISRPPISLNSGGAASSNATVSLTPQIKVVAYPWNVRALTETTIGEAKLAETTPLDISSQVMSFTYSKNLGNPSGTFSLTLANSPNYGSGDWKDILKPGTWISVFLTQDGDLTTTQQIAAPIAKSSRIEEGKKRRLLGVVDRIAANATIADNDAFDLTFEVSGRDFGITYEETTIWHNMFTFESIMLQSLATSKLNVVGITKIHTAIELIHNLFFNPKAVAGAKVNDKKSLLSIALQWIMPSQLMADLGITDPSKAYWGELEGLLDLAPTIAGISISQPSDYLSGNAWDALKRLSCPPLHELFTEMDDDGMPHLYFRPIPWSLNSAKYPSAATTVLKYLDLPTVEVFGEEVLGFHVGEDNHSLYNSFLLTAATSTININDNISPLLGKGFPKHIQDSVRRYGFRPMHVTIDSLVRNEGKNNGEANNKLLTEYNELMVDYWKIGQFSESGELNILGRNDVRIGKAVRFDASVPYLANKQFYIESYTDSFVVDQGTGACDWTQSLLLSRGFELSDLEDQAKFEERAELFQQEGEFTPYNKR